MSSSVSICAVCAWRASCQKKFSVSGRDMRCAEFVRDVTIKEEPQEKEPTEEKKKNKKKKDK
jgi:hypothetical protein